MGDGGYGDEAFEVHDNYMVLDEHFSGGGCPQSMKGLLGYSAVPPGPMARDEGKQK